jgi:signal transduction histidine kinase
MRRYATQMRRSAESLGTLIDDLFELVQLEPEAIAAEARRATVEEVVTSALAACGEGIPTDSLDRVFEPFWRGDAARSSEGAGLGLALSKRIVECLGGEIEVDSDPD